MSGSWSAYEISHPSTPYHPAHSTWAIRHTDGRTAATFTNRADADTCARMMADLPSVPAILAMLWDIRPHLILMVAYGYDDGSLAKLNCLIAALEPSPTP